MTAVAAEPAALLEAHEPPEARGLARDQVRLLVAGRRNASIVHARFRDLPAFLAAGDLVVVNTSATLPAALPARREDGSVLILHLSTPAPEARDEEWIVELRREDASFREGRAGERLLLPGGGSAEILAPYAPGRRFWLAALDLPRPLEEYLGEHGSPIRYSYVGRSWPLAAHQTVFALEPGSAEMPSAGRPFTPELVTGLVSAGILLAPVTLHTGVSSPEAREPPTPERYRVPEETARLVNAVHDWGGRVVAVGTTVVRALESVAAADGTVEPGAGWTNLVVTPERGLRAIDGLISGFHELEASHLQILRASAGDALLHCSYRAARENGYRRHEFGDSHLVLP